MPKSIDVEHELTLPSVRDLIKSTGCYHRPLRSAERPFARRIGVRAASKCDSGDSPTNSQGIQQIPVPTIEIGMNGLVV